MYTRHNNIERLRKARLTPALTTLNDAYACFRGLERPHDEEPDGSSVVVYVLRPNVSIEYESDIVCMAKARIVEQNLALTVQVRPAQSLQICPAGVEGTVTRVEFVPCDEDMLPRGWGTRYKKQHWRR